MSRKRKASRRKIKRSPFLHLFLLAILVLLSFTATVYLLFLQPGTHPAATPQKTTVVPQKKVSPAPTRQPKQTPKQQSAAKIAPTPQKQKAGPKVALLIDDIGNTRKIAEQFVALDLNLNFSILPHTPYGLKIAQKAHAKGSDILLHLPMEATDKKWDPGTGALFLRMDPSTVQKTLEADLQQVPMAVGVNNHMGSRYSESDKGMDLLLKMLKNRGLFYLDSLTSSKSVGFSMARTIGVPTAKRDIFLDNEKDTKKTVQQIKRLITIAKKHGTAIGIGHPYPTTLAALQQTQSTLLQEVTLTTLHSLVK